MKYLIIYDARDGQIMQIQSPAPEGKIPREVIPEGMSAIRTAQKISGHTHIVKGGKVRSKPRAQIERAEINHAWADLRTQRARRLISSDWTQAPDAPVDQEAWRAYRQALRDLPANTTDPRNPDWPEPPK